MTLALAMIMIVLIGVMGAGLLTFVSTDLNTVTEQNRGQRAFDVADAGIEAAKHQLATGPDRTKYDGNGAGNCSDLDIQWSALRCANPKGLTLTNLDGVPTTSDSATVTIRYIGCAGCATDYFRVISTGTYGDPPRQSKRRIESIFNGVTAGIGDGPANGHPVYYTNSSIKILSTGSNNVTLSQVSLFSLKDILIQDFPANSLTTSGRFQDDMEDKGNAASKAIKVSGNDKLCDWNSATPLNNCFENGTDGDWNTQPRPTDSPAMAALGKICSFTAASASSCAGRSSIADNKYGFDSLTALRFVLKNCQINNLPESQCGVNPLNTISPPFPLPKPIPAGLKGAAQTQLCTASEIQDGTCKYNPNEISYFVGDPGATSSWGLGNSNASNDNKVAFVDAQNQTLTYNPGGGKYKGIIVVWCGRLKLGDSFRGIILNLVGTLPGNTTNTTCTTETPIVTPGETGQTVGTFENLGYMCECWVYAEGGNTAGTTVGIQIDPGSTIKFRPSQDWRAQNGLFLTPPPTNFKPQYWRELYQASP